MTEHNQLVVIDTWNNGNILCIGTRQQCENYIKKNNIYQSNYTKLKIVLVNQIL